MSLKSISHFSHATSLKEQALAYPTAIHENLHIINDYLASVARAEGKSYVPYFYGDTTFYIKKFPLPPTDTVGYSVDFKNISYLRFNIYILDTTNKAYSKIGGLYGLLDEFQAYQLGFEAHISLWEELGDYSFSKRDDSLEYFNQGYDQVKANYEFQNFIILYLKSLKRSDIGLYNNVISDKNFTGFYTHIRDRFKHSELILDCYYENFERKNIKPSDNYITTPEGYISITLKSQIQFLKNQIALNQLEGFISK